MPIDPIERADELAKRSPRELALLVVELEKERDAARAGHIAPVPRSVVIQNLVDGAYELRHKLEAAEQRVVEAEKERDERQALAEFWNKECTKAWDARDKAIAFNKIDAEAAEQQIAQLRSALAELVRLKDLKESYGNAQNFYQDEAVTAEWERRRDEYHRCLLPAWQAARKALETGEPNEQR